MKTIYALMIPEDRRPSLTLECNDNAIIIFTKIAVHVIVKMLNAHEEFGTYRKYSTPIPENEAM
jgi:hypothetical protein